MYQLVHIRICGTYCMIYLLLTSVSNKRKTRGYKIENPAVGRNLNRNRPRPMQ